MVSEARCVRWWIGAIAIGLISALTAAPAHAQESDEEAPWRSRISIGRVVNGDTPAQVLRPDGAVVDVSAGNGVALFYDISRRLTPRVSAQVGFGYWTFPSHASSPVSSSALSADLNGFRAGEVHLGIVYAANGARLINPYGAALLVANTGDVAVADQGATPLRVSLAAQVGPALQGGVLIGGCGSRPVGLDLSIRRSLLRTTVSGGALYDLSPWVFSVGISVRH
jgi:hypothetical protein